MKQPTQIQIRAFRDAVYRHSRRHGRHDLPWRRTADPYHILVSEVMLQQTQVPRVARMYPGFIARFPDVRSLARAPLRQVLRAWSGMGYNRRALYLKRCAEIICREHGGLVPETTEDLTRLPGIGINTAGAILAYAFDMPAVFIETNIRAAFIHCFFEDRTRVPDSELTILVSATLDRRHPRRWYGALMDYGAMIKRTHGNPARRSARHARQGRFEGSDRQLRGAAIRLLTGRSMTVPALRRALDEPAGRVITILRALVAEGLIALRAGRYAIR